MIPTKGMAGVNPPRMESIERERGEGGYSKDRVDSRFGELDGLRSTKETVCWTVSEVWRISNARKGSRDSEEGKSAICKERHRESSREREGERKGEERALGSCCSATFSSSWDSRGWKIDVGGQDKTGSEFRGEKKKIWLGNGRANKRSVWGSRLVSEFVFLFGFEMEAARQRVVPRMEAARAQFLLPCSPLKAISTLPLQISVLVSLPAPPVPFLLSRFIAKVDHKQRGSQTSEALRLRCSTAAARSTRFSGDEQRSWYKREALKRLERSAQASNCPFGESGSLQTSRSRPRLRIPKQ